jgi:uncharacterized protein YaaW (UPF0174 family)
MIKNIIKQITPPIIWKLARKLTLRERFRESKYHSLNELDRKIVSDFIILFNNLNNREPMESEIIDNLKEKIDVNTIKKIIEQNKTLSVKINVDDYNIV